MKKLFRWCLLMLFIMTGYSFGECRHAVDVSCGEDHSLILTNNGSLWACGSNGLQALGVGSSTSSSPTPIQVKGENGEDYLSDIVGFDAGWKHSLACDSSGNVWAWGTDSCGQLGNGSNGNSEYPQKVLGLYGSGHLQNIVFVSAGRSGEHSLALDENGYVYAWGFNGYGQCGNGTNTNPQVPVRVITESDTNLSGIIAVNAGVHHSLVLASDGRVWEFGSNNSSNKAKLVPNSNGSGYLENITAIATCDYSLAVDTSGHVWCWGGGTPSLVSGLENIVDVSSGHTYYLALDSDGYLWKWTNGATPYKITDGEMNTESGYLENIIAADAGYYEFALTVDAYGGVWGFGSVNSAGQLGVGDTTSRSEPALAECETGTLLIDITHTPTDACLSPDDEATVTVCVTNDMPDTYENVYVVLHLDNGFTYPDGQWLIDEDLNPYQIDPGYDEESHTISYYIGSDESGTIAPGEQSCKTFTFTVNENSVSGMQLINNAELFQTVCTVIPDPNDPNNPDAATTVCEDVLLEDTTDSMPVCCWDNSAVLYVSENAVGACTGNSWSDAYNTEYGLKMALERAMESTCAGQYTIYVAQGTYLPGTGVSDSFDLPDGTAVYGGFPVKGCGFDDRNPKKYKSVLSGLVENGIAYSVVNMGYEAVLEGVTVTDGYDYDVYGNYFSLKNCIIENSIGYGVYSEYGDVTIKSCTIRNNDTDGIHHESIGNNLYVYNSWVMRNNYHGIYCLYTTPTIVSSIVSESDMSNEGRAGVYIKNPASTPIMQNCTVANNKSFGIQFTDLAVVPDPNDPNNFTMDYPDLDSCIIYFNHKNNGVYENQISGMNVDSVASYCCIQGCDANNNRNNINDIPMFAYEVDPTGEPDPCNYHIAFDSICINKGNPNLIYDTDQTDYDNESRVEGAYVDMGADEVYSCSGEYTEEDISNPLDTNVDGVINMIEFQPIAAGWLSLDPNNPRWDSDPNWADPNSTECWNGAGNIDDTGDSQYIIDMADLELFCSNWLWTACWYEAANATETTAASTESATLLSSSSVSTLSTDTVGVNSLARTASTLLLTEDTTEDDSSMYDSMSTAEIIQTVRDIRYLQSCVEEMLEISKDTPEYSENEEDLLDVLAFFDDELAKIKESLQ